MRETGKKVEEKKVVPATPSATKIKVVNTSKKSVNLAHGAIESGKTGIATSAELSLLGKVISRPTQVAAK